MPFRLFEPALGIGADALAMPGDVVGDLAQPVIRGGQRPPQRVIAPLDADLPCATAPTAAKEQQNNHHNDDNHDGDDADRDPQPDPLG